MRGGNSFRRISAAAACAGVLVLAADAAARDFGPWDGDIAVGDRSLSDGAFPVPPGPRVAGHASRDAMAEGAILLIRVFQIWISPQDGPSCRFHPVCSAYGRAAVARYGAFLGSILAGDRILRCNPFSEPGEDPVPDCIFPGK